VDAARALLRIVTGLLFMQHGLQKLFGLLASPGRPPVPTPAPFTKYWIAGVLELFGGGLFVLGLFTRPVAFLLSGEMAVAYFTVHSKRGFFPIQNAGEVVVLYCFIYLYFVASGAGECSLDGWWSRRRR
jgi:putative oxidoreductase